MTSPAGAAPAPAANPVELLRSRNYLVLLVLGSLVGVVVAFVAYFILKFVAVAQNFVFATLPKDCGFHSAPVWWPILPLALSGLLVGLSLQYLPGTGGHKPAEGFKAGGAVAPIDLPGIVVASLATLCLGAVLGPEAPLIAIGSGLGVLAVHLVKKDAPPMAAAVIGGAGSFAAISTLLGSPIVGAFLLMEASGLGGPLLGVVLVPGLLAAGIGSLIFIGLDHWTGYGTFSLSIGSIPPFASPTLAEFFWAFGIGIVAAVIGAVIKRGGLKLQPLVERRKILLTPLVGLMVAALAIIFAEATGKPSSFVLFSGQSALPDLVQPRGHVDGRGTGGAAPVQGDCLQPVSQWLSRRPGLPRHVHRRHARDRAVPSPRPAHDRRGRYGHRGDQRRNVGPPAGLGSPPLAPVELRQREPDASDHHGDGGVVRGVSATRTRADPRRDRPRILILIRGRQASACERLLGVGMTFVVCTDGSDLALEAATIGLSLLRQADAVVVATVVDDLDFVDDSTGHAGPSMTDEELAPALQRGTNPR